MTVCMTAFWKLVLQNKVSLNRQFHAENGFGKLHGFLMKIYKNQLANAIAETTKVTSSVTFYAVFYKKVL